MSDKEPRCRGLLGLLFGHQYLKSRGGYTYNSRYCFRCGKLVK